MTKEERDLLMAVAHALKLSHKDVETCIGKVDKQEPEKKPEQTKTSDPVNKPPSTPASYRP